MAFVVVAIALGGFTLYNLQTELSNKGTKADNKPFNYKLNNILTFWKPLTEPKRKWGATETYAKKMRALNRASSNNPLEQKMGTAEVTTYGYRTGGGGRITPIAPSSQLGRDRKSVV